MTITELSIKRPTLVVVVFSFLAVLGIFGFIQLKYELLPNMTPPIVTIITAYPGGSPNEVETSVTKVVEDAISGMDKISSVRSSSYEGRSMVIIEFDQSADVDLAVQDAQRKVNEISDRLPINAKKPIISKIAFDELPVLRMAVKGNMKTTEFYQFIKDKIQPRLSRIGGVGQVFLLGGEEREIKVYFDLEKMKSMGLSVAQVTQVIKASNVDFPTGKIKDSDNQYIIRVAGKFESTEQMRNLVIGKSKTGGEIKLSDFAEVQDGSVDADNFNRLNGVPSIGITVQKQTDANTVEVSENLRKEMKKLENEYSNIGLKFDVAQDNSEFTLASANAVKEDLAIAIVLVAVVMLVFLHSVRNSFIVMVAIPTSLISTFFLMWAFGFSLNLMTLLAMSLVIGILVDDSIVVLENIYRHLEMGEKPRDAALKGRNEIGFAALSITMVDVVVFVPMAMISGMIGSLVRQYSLVVVFSTLMSLFVSFTITPALAARITKLENMTKNTLMGRFGLWFEKMYDKLTGYYKRLLEWSLHNGGKIAILTIILFFTSIVLPRFGFIGTEFMPNVDRGEFSVILELDPGASIEMTNAMTQKVENLLAGFPEVERILTNVGSSSEGLIGQYSNNTSQINVTLMDKNKRKKTLDEVSFDIKKEIQKIPGVKVRITPISIMGFTNRAPIQILISGTDFESVNKGAKQMIDVVRDIQGTMDVRLSSEEGKPELQVMLDREKMSLLGVTINDVGAALRIALTGDNDSKFREGVTEYDIRILLDEYNREKTGNLGNFAITNSKGQQVELKQFASFYQTTGPTKLERQDRMNAITLSSQVFGKTSGDIANEIRTKMQNTQLPPGVSYKFTGEQKTMADSFKSLLIALFAAILFVFMIMVALYNSYLYPLAVLFSIPLAVIGAFYGLALTMNSISIYSLLGMIMLVGLVAKNAILLVDRANQMREEKGLSTYDALVEAGQTRLRPILMTTFAMVMGMLPIALSTSAGSEAKSALAIVLIGGLLSSMFLTLVLVPIVYQRLDKWKVSLSRKFFRKKKEEPAVEG